MPEPQTPGPGRVTADAAVNELKKQIAKRNEEAHREDRDGRAARERERAVRRRAERE